MRFVNEGGDGRERIPPFINFIRDVRKEDAYRLRHIAKRKEEPQLERP